MVIVITGPISSGKTTLGGSLATVLGALHLSSDAIRMEMTGSSSGKAPQIWPVMKQRMDAALAKGIPVILDATPMSPSFREIVHGARQQAYCTIIGLEVSMTEWEKRELSRNDRLKKDDKGQLTPFKMSPTVYERSVDAFMPHYDLVINTNGKTPQNVFKEALDFITKRSTNWEVLK